MAEILLEDYFAGSGGFVCNKHVDDQAARLALTGLPTNYVVEQAYTTFPTAARKVFRYDGGGESNPSNWTDVTSTADCTAALQAAFDDLSDNEGGTIVIPQGVCRLNGKVQKFPYAPITLKSHGDGALRLLYHGDRGLSIGASQQVLFLDGVNIVGELGDYTNSQVVYASNSSPIWAGAAEFKISHSNIIGLGTNYNGQEHGVLHLEQANSLIDTVIFNGSIGTYSAVLNLRDAKTTNVKNCEFLDYTTFRGNVYSKTPQGNQAWIRSNNTTVPLVNKFDTLIVEGSRFDEGAGYHIHVVGGLAVLITGCYGNIGAGVGYYIENVDYVKVEASKLAYSTSGSKLAAEFKDCGTVELYGFKLGDDVDYITISGTTRQVIMRECDLQPGHNATYPTGINNAAGADIVINGIRQVNGLTQIG